MPMTIWVLLVNKWKVVDVDVLDDEIDADVDVDVTEDDVGVDVVVAGVVELDPARKGV